MAGRLRSEPPAFSSQPTVEIPARHGTVPFCQGLDGLCGVYSVLNAIRLARAPFAPLLRSEAKHLFAAAVEWLDGRGGLEHSVTTGMAMRRWRAIAKRLTALASTETATLSIERPDDAAWVTVDESFAWIADSLAQGKPVLIALMGGLNHFTVCHGMTAARLQLFDSTDLKFVRKACCATDRDAFHVIPRKGLMRIAVHPGR